MRGVSQLRSPPADKSGSAKVLSSTLPRTSMALFVVILALSNVSYVSSLFVGNPTSGQGGLVSRDAVAYKDPRDGSGSMLDTSAGLGEPLNVHPTYLAFTQTSSSHPKAYE